MMQETQELVPVLARAADVALVAAHGLLGTGMVVAGAAALATRKGAHPHRRAGRAYVRATGLVVASGAVLLVAGRASLRLALLLALTAYVTWSAVRVLRRRRPDVDPAHRATRADWAAALATVAVGLAILAASAAGLEPGNATAIRTTAPLLVGYALWDLWRFARPGAWPMRPRLWLYEHIVKATGAWAGAVSALAGNVLTFLPMPGRIVWPNVLGVALTLWLLWRHRARSARAAAAVPLASPTASPVAPPLAGSRLVRAGEMPVRPAPRHAAAARA